MATRTTTTSRIKIGPEPSADYDAENADFSFEELVQAYFDCRRTKRNSHTALAFELNLERNLAKLNEELRDGRYTPGRSICFVVTHPKAREVWAADFRDRIVHHLLFNRIAPRFHRSFISDSCACIKGRGTMYAAQRLDGMVRSQTQNWSKPGYYLKADIANFFVTIDKSILAEQITAKVAEPWWLDLANTILWHDPRQNYEFRGSAREIQRVPHHKRLTNQPVHLGLPIGNLSSQFFANVYLNALDQFAKHQLRAKHYVRYVDDFVILSDSKDYLSDCLCKIEAFLPERLHVRLNPKKTILQPIERGIDFVGQIIKPWHTTTRRKTVNHAISQIKRYDMASAYKSANSYFGLLRQATANHHDRSRLARAVLQRGLMVDGGFTKAFKPREAA